MNLYKNDGDNFGSLVTSVRNNVCPARPEYITYSSRLLTFKSFPLASFQNKYSLADSGFIYSGKGDIVECFCCGLTLHDWQKNDIPWIEHSRCNPNCTYVLLLKGNRFVEHVKTITHYDCNCNCKSRSYDTVE